MKVPLPGWLWYVGCGGQRRPRIIRGIAQDITHLIGHMPLVQLNSIPYSEGGVGQIVVKLEGIRPDWAQYDPGGRDRWPDSAGENGLVGVHRSQHGNCLSDGGSGERLSPDSDDVRHHERGKAGHAAGL